ncbi:hypothetical protein OBBRIDRAFT_888128 [Obba rivulosa]|uniref:Uncharacterized protein n=1 Tax=Obba rivulosa TaxID=1052685 RepID=A0A8E2ASJ1_9APHY|nr:hypothetical protein OBBRIDRAFT_888128 [Obba rivulosa]
MSIEKLIAVMGPDESDKATFIDRASGSRHRETVDFFPSMRVSEATGPIVVDDFEFSYRFIHIPAIGSATGSEAETLFTIAGILASLYKDDVRLNGVIYLMDDSTGTSDAHSDFEIIEKLCGNDVMPNFLIQTDQHIQGTSPWDRAINAGARCVSHNLDGWFVHHILRHWYKRSRKTLLIQSEMVDHGLDFSQTSAGRMLRRELIGQLQNQVEELCNARTWKLNDTASAARRRIAQLTDQLQALNAISEIHSVLAKLPTRDVDLMAPVPRASLSASQATGAPSAKKSSLEEQVQALAEELVKTQRRLAEAESRIDELETQMKNTTTLVLPPLPERGPETMTLRIKLT